MRTDDVVKTLHGLEVQLGAVDIRDADDDEVSIIAGRFDLLEACTLEALGSGLPPSRFACAVPTP